MTINGTLFVQIINFFIAYLIMRTFLFKPVIAIIHSEKTEQERLHATLEALKMSVDLAQQEYAQLWTTFHASVSSDLSAIAHKNIPSVPDHIVIEPHTLTPQKYDSLITSCVQHVIQQVNHVRK